ncbi:hypothetical protein C8Q78DRAFT_1074936 [Trametes maxima]|nr:hypothetical protein C8Q78DRAFT_1074936 [Trametes maxima]
MSSGSPPKSCLKRHSLPNSARPLCMDSGARTLTRPAGYGPPHECNSHLGSDRGPPTSYLSAHPPPSASAKGVPQTRRKSVSFAEEHDVRLVYPFNDPLHIQARRQVVRIFRAFADALRIDPVDGLHDSDHESTSSEEFDEDREEAEK